MRGARKQARDRLQRKLSREGLSKDDIRLYRLSQSACLLRMELKKKNNRIKELKKVLEGTQWVREHIDDLVKLIDSLDEDCKELTMLNRHIDNRTSSIVNKVNYYGKFLREMQESPEWSSKRD